MLSTRFYVLTSLIALTLRLLIKSGTMATVLSGIKHGSALDLETVEPNSKLVLTVFGRNLWPGRFRKLWVTTAEHCDESYSIRKTRFELDVMEEFSTPTSLVLHLPAGLPEYKDGPYLLCSTPSAISDGVVSGLGKLVVRQAHALRSPLWATVLFLVFLVAMSALFSGLNLSFTSVALNELDILQRMGDAYQSRLAKSIVPVRRHLNWIICTFATANAIANCLISLLSESLLNHLSHGRMPFILPSIIPTFFIVIFAEILPLAVCNRRGLIIASKTRFITWAVMIVLCPFAWPLSKLLDQVIGCQGCEVYDRSKIEFLLLQAARTSTALFSEILQNAITLPSIKVANAMTKIEEAFLLSTTDVLDTNRILSIVERGYTRIPVYEGGRKSRVVAVLNVKDLIAADFTEQVVVIDILQKFNYMKQIRFVCEGMQVKPLMVEMEGQNFGAAQKDIQGYISHMAMVVRYDSKSYTLVGLITLDDIIEEIFGEMKDEALQWTNRRIGVHRDQSTLDWLRMKPDPISPLEQILCIQNTLCAFPAFKDMSLNIHSIRHLFSLCEIRSIKINEQFNLYRKGHASRSISVVLLGDAYCCDKHGVRCAPRPVDMGAELAEAILQRFLDDGLDADLSDLYFLAPRNVYLDGGTVFIKVKGKALRDSMVRMSMDRSKREVSTHSDVWNLAECPLNSHTELLNSPTPSNKSLSLTGQEDSEGNSKSTEITHKSPDSTQSETSMASSIKFPSVV